MSEKIRYSPYPLEEYVAEYPEGSVGYGTMSKLCDPAVWNLVYFLSRGPAQLMRAKKLSQSMDDAPVDSDLIPGCVIDVDKKVGGRVLRELVTTLYPGEFGAYLLEHRCQHLTVYERYGVKLWPVLIKLRLKNFEGVVQKKGNIIHLGTLKQKGEKQ